MMRLHLLLASALLLAAPAENSAQQRPTQPAAQQPRTRLMDELNWVEFGEGVPARVRTVIVRVGRVEPRGVGKSGADIAALVAVARSLAGDAGIDAFIAPHIPYGVTGSMAPYPGALHIPDDVFRAYFRAVLEGM